jgi:hypothetical protein
MEGSRKGGITDSVYNRYEYDAEKRAALELWADGLDGIIGGHPTETGAIMLGLHASKERTKVKVA